MVVLACNAVVQVGAVVVESLGASFAGVAMVAGNVDELPALIAVLELPFIIVLFYAKDKIVNGIAYC